MLLGSLEFSEELASAAESCSSSIVLASAFIKTRALTAILKAAKPSTSVSVIARWRPQDLVSNASDLNAYEFCVEHEYQFGISQNFHGKLYVLDRTDVLLGSANLTTQGLALQSKGNIEFGAKIRPRVEDIEKINKFLKEEVIWLSSTLYSSICDEISSMKSHCNLPLETLKWSNAVTQALEKPVSYLWVSELLFRKPSRLLNINFNDSLEVHDFELLNLDVDKLNIPAIKQAFRSSKVYLWINNQLKTHQKVRFGKLSHLLHNALLDDPKPYRKEVKDFVAVMYAWFEFMEEDFELSSYNHTTAVELKTLQSSA
ncbi:MAG: phospholipase D-like domain-containing protein [Gammaproteobacteria bacterium]|nr:phospholipase D-like domain-containing protein [Gammaproteobacteria bacterium]